MKNDNNHHIRQARQQSSHKVRATDILVNQEVVRSNQARLVNPPRRKRHINYAKKIQNDPFIFSI